MSRFPMGFNDITPRQIYGGLALVFFILFLVGVYKATNPLLATPQASATPTPVATVPFPSLHERQYVRTYQSWFTHVGTETYDLIRAGDKVSIFVPNVRLFMR